MFHFQITLLYFNQTLTFWWLIIIIIKLTIICLCVTIKFCKVNNISTNIKRAHIRKVLNKHKSSYNREVTKYSWLLLCK